MAKRPVIKLATVLCLFILCSTAAWAQSGSYRLDLVIYDDGQGNNLKAPAGVACSADRTVVADTGNSRVLTYETSDRMMDLASEIKLVRQIRPALVQMGADGLLLVYDSRAKEILRFDGSGKRIGSVEPKDLPSGSRIILKSFRVDESGSIYLLDVFGRRVVVLDKTGVFLRQTAFPLEFGFISDLAVDDRGRVYIIDSVRSQVFSAQPEEESFTPLSDSLKDHLSYPTRLEVDSKGLIYIVDEETSSLGVLRRDGSFKGSLFNRGRKEGLLYYPSQICVEDGSRIIIADRDNSRVQVFVEKE